MKYDPFTVERDLARLILIVFLGALVWVWLGACYWRTTYDPSVYQVKGTTCPRGERLYVEQRAMPSTTQRVASGLRGFHIDATDIMSQLPIVTPFGWLPEPPVAPWSYFAWCRDTT